MTLWELRQRISGDDYRIEGSDPEVNQLCAELKDEEVHFLVRLPTESPTRLSAWCRCRLNVRNNSTHPVPLSVLGPEAGRNRSSGLITTTSDSLTRNRVGRRIPQTNGNRESRGELDPVQSPLHPAARAEPPDHIGVGSNAEADAVDHTRKAIFGRDKRYTSAFISGVISFSWPFAEIRRRPPGPRVNQREDLLPTCA